MIVCEALALRWAEDQSDCWQVLDGQNSGAGVRAGYLCDLENPGMNFADECGFKVSEEPDEDSLKELDLEVVRELKPSSSGGPDPELGPNFSRGDEVTVIRRMSWNLLQKGAPNFRKDIVVGTSGIVEGWGDLDNRLVLLKSGP